MLVPSLPVSRGGRRDGQRDFPEIRRHGHLPLINYVSRADSGSTMHRRFRARCGTPVLSEAEPRPHQTIVRVGTLDDPNLARPGGIIWTKSAPSKA